MDKIKIQGMQFYGYHGVFEEEREKGQTFVVDVQLFVDLSLAGKNDELSQTVDYGQVYELISNIVTTKKFRLIEALAEEISKLILTEYAKVERVIVEVKKPNPPVKGDYEYFSVEIDRCRNGK